MSNIIDELTEILEQRKAASTKESYVANLHAQGINKILEKVGEEAIETIIAAKDHNKTIDQSREAVEIYNYLVEITKKTYEKTAFGKFGANMRITLENDGPVTFCLRI